MKKLLAVIVGLIILLTTSSALAWKVPDNPNPSFVSDTSHVLSDEAHSRLDVQLQQVNRVSANEIAVLLLDTLNDQSVEDVSFQTAKAWGVGKKGLDNGVLIVLAMKERRSRIEVGKGAEGDLPDLKAADILHNVVRPQMQAHHVEQALSDAITAIAASMANHQVQAAQSSLASANDGAKVSAGLSIVVWLVLLGLLGATAILIIRSLNRRKKQDRDLYSDNMPSTYVSSGYIPATYSRSVPTSYDSRPTSTSYDSDTSSSDSSSSDDSSFGGGDFGGGGSSSDF